MRAKILKLSFFNEFKNGLHHLNPIFMPFPKWYMRFLYVKNWQSYKRFSIFSSFGPFEEGFAKIALGTTYMLQSLQKGSHFFHKSPFYLLIMFLDLIHVFNVPKLAEMYHIFKKIHFKWLAPSFY